MPKIATTEADAVTLDQGTPANVTPSGDSLAIRVEGLSKIYRIGVEDSGDDNFASAALAFVKSPLSNFRKYRSLYQFDDVDDGAETPSDILWALRDLSFEVSRGEVVGIIGVNGAGKSTLLKVLSRITPPTRGSVRIWGRVSSLLEVGTGFHQELTGRDNIYLNGTVLGMMKREVDAKFDEIVDFSGVEKFLDTPVKRYSSGMRVRLAFAVAAFLEPEILIIDEVLAVGDAAFQKKCMNKMQDVGAHGRTVLFVSHNMAAVTRLCQRCILLNGGKLVEDGTSEDVVAAYLNSGQGISAERTWDDPATAPGDEVVRLRGIRVKSEDGVVRESLDIRKPIGLEMDFEVFEGGHQLLPYYDLHNDEGTRVFSAVDLDREWDGVPRKPGRYVSTAWIPGNLLNEGMIYVRSTIRTSNRKVRRISIRDAVAFHVTDTGEPGASRGSFPGRLAGAVRPLLNWETTFKSR